MITPNIQFIIDSAFKRGYFKITTLLTQTTFYIHYLTPFYFNRSKLIQKTCLAI
ncbi:hypothetical protein STFR1_30622 [Bacillus vallismortis]